MTSQPPNCTSAHTEIMTWLPAHSHSVLWQRMTYGWLSVWLWSSLMGENWATSWIWQSWLDFPAGTMSVAFCCSNKPLRLLPLTCRTNRSCGSVIHYSCKYAPLLNRKAHREKKVCCNSLYCARKPLWLHLSVIRTYSRTLNFAVLLNSLSDQNVWTLKPNSVQCSIPMKL